MSRSSRHAASPPPTERERRENNHDKEREREKDARDAKADESSSRLDAKTSKDKERDVVKSGERPPSDDSKRYAEQIEQELRTARLQRVESSQTRALVADSGDIVKLNVGGTRFFTTKVLLI
jgi:hypothetical protein